MEPFILINAQPFKMAALLRRVMRISSAQGVLLPRVNNPVAVNKVALGKSLKLAMCSNNYLFCL